MRLTVIHNPNAGEKERGDTLVKEMAAAGHEVTYVNTKKAELEEALREPGDLVVIAGGDGTVHKVVKHMIGRPTPLVVIPLGTANNIASTLGVHDRPDHLAEYLETLMPAPFDAGMCRRDGTDTPFIESLGGGVLGTLMTELADRKRRERMEDKQRGFADELEILHDLVESAEPFEAEIFAEGADLSDDYLLVELMNIRSVGPKVQLAPQADPSDGLLDLVLVRAGEREMLSDFIEAIRQRKPLPALPVRRVRELRASWENGFHADDKLCAEARSRFECTIRHGAVTMLVPAEQRRQSGGRRTTGRN